MNQLTTFKDVKIPVFPFPKTIMTYIFDAAKPDHYKKLNQTCKYIFAKYQRNCVEWIHLEEAYFNSPQKPVFFEKYKFLTKKEEDFARLSPNLWLMSYLELNHALTNLYKTLIPKISISSLANLTLKRSADFLYEDYKFLTASGNIETLDIYDTKIIYSNGEAVEFENILSQVVNAKFITLNPIHTTEDTMENLLNIQWNPRHQLTMFRLSFIDNYLDPNKFFDFLTKISCMKLMKGKGKRCYVKFNTEEETRAFNAIFSKKIEEYKEPVKGKPEENV
uniref:F-box domain-containing protein n=1 Tax=Panagrolaimus sp. PS1159 TaxID=55785 RepID=A0AC35GBX4_9BILA